MSSQIEPCAQGTDLHGDGLLVPRGNSGVEARPEGCFESRSGVAKNLWRFLLWRNPFFAHFRLQLPPGPRRWF